MAPNPRGPIYAQVQAALRRRLAPEEKARLDRLLDDLGVAGRFR